MSYQSQHNKLNRLKIEIATFPKNIQERIARACWMQTKLHRESRYQSCYKIVLTALNKQFSVVLSAVENSVANPQVMIKAEPITDALEQIYMRVSVPFARYTYDKLLSKKHNLQISF
jgi:hypothetical protein